MVKFNIAHNDDQGRPISKAYEIILSSSIAEDDFILHLEAKDFMKGETLEIGADFISFPNGCSVRYNSCHPWTGNIFWNGYTMTAGWGLGFLYLLQQSGNWNVIEGWSELFDKFAGMVEITAQDLGLAADIKKLYRTPGQYSLFHEYITNETGELAFYFSTGND